ncbi:unnamed protein product [Cylicocyclus nassatus]|uniref:Uncharacterized protein n=1 Tax=Cylicocyclus nassatus TaxID=53992 RepID=A0AA36GSM5_CYLNA|nr:unnamed protein product [Cylicocyclus nassatus]
MDSIKFVKRLTLQAIVMTSKGFIHYPSTFDGPGIPLRRAPIICHGSDKTWDSRLQYRSATGSRVNVALEHALTKRMASMAEADVKIAQALGPEACFGGLRVAESAVCAKRMYLEKKYAILSKVDALVDRIQINVNVQTSGPPPKQQQTKVVDDNIEEPLLSQCYTILV